MEMSRVVVVVVVVLAIEAVVAVGGAGEVVHGAGKGINLHRKKEIGLMIVSLSTTVEILFEIIQIMFDFTQRQRRNPSAN